MWLDVDQRAPLTQHVYALLQTLSRCAEKDKVITEGKYI